MRLNKKSVIILMAGVACSLGAPDVADQVFATTPQRDLTLDLYRPKAAGRPPLLVFIHGGSWRWGSPKDVPFLFLLDEGIAVASIGYRFSQEARFPAQIQDVRAALAWLISHADSLGFDGSRIALCGLSAGGHLAMLAGCPADTGTGPIRAVVTYFAPTDFLLRGRTQPERANPPGLGTYDLLGAPPLEIPELAKAASPAWQVGPSAPPLLLFHGNSDTIVLFDQAERMVEAYRVAGRPITTHFRPDAGHDFAHFDNPECHRILLDFLREHLGLP